MNKRVLHVVITAGLLCSPVITLAAPYAQAKFKTADGRIIHAQVDMREVSHLRKGDKVELWGAIGSATIPARSQQHMNSESTSELSRIRRDIDND